MKFLKKLFKKKPIGQTKIFTRGNWHVLKNGRYVNGLAVFL